LIANRPIVGALTSARLLMVHVEPERFRLAAEDGPLVGGP